MNERPGRRVVVTHPRTAAARASTARGVRLDLHHLTPLGETIMRSLRRDQLRLALLVIAALSALLGGVPLLFFGLSALGTVHVLGLPLGGLLLGLGAFPLVCGIAWVYVRAAEANEDETTDLVERL